MTALVQATVDTIAGNGIDIELIDLRSLWPWDIDAVLKSVRKTGRLLVIHEAVEVCGFGAEIVARVTEHMFDDLKRAPKRLGAPRVPGAFSPPLENVYRIDTAKIELAINEMMAS